MTKNEFLNRYRQENLKIGDYIMVLNEVTDDPLVMGCAFNNGAWQVYKTKERGGHYVIREFKTENEAFDYFYELVLSFHNRHK
jgi:hypothetical protein